MSSLPRTNSEAFQSERDGNRLIKLGDSLGVEAADLLYKPRPVDSSDLLKERNRGFVEPGALNEHIKLGNEALLREDREAAKAEFYLALGEPDTIVKPRGVCVIRRIVGGVRVAVPTLRIPPRGATWIP